MWTWRGGSREPKETLPTAIHSITLWGLFPQIHTTQLSPSSSQHIWHWYHNKQNKGLFQLKITTKQNILSIYLSIFPSQHCEWSFVCVCVRSANQVIISISLTNAQLTHTINLDINWCNTILVHITYKNLTPNICTTAIDLTLKIQTCRVRISHRVRLIQSVKNLLNKQNFTFWHSDIIMTLKINVTGTNMNKYSSIKVSAIQRLLCLQTRKCEPNTDHYTTHMVLMRSKMTVFVGNTTFFFWIAL